MNTRNIHSSYQSIEKKIQDFTMRLVKKGNTTQNETLRQNDANSTAMTRKLSSLVNNIDQQHRTIFLMHYKGYASNEIAKKLNISTQVVNSSLLNAKQQLKDSIRLKRA